MSDEPTGRERRQAPRLNLVNFVWFHVLGQAIEGVGKMVDISTTGIGIEVTRAIAKGQQVFLEIVTRRFNLSVLGEVMFSKSIEGGAHRVGIQFTVVQPNNRLILKELAAGVDEAD